ncbi:hypothetical protein ACLMJK_002186 [Lecanora helva]
MVQGLPAVKWTPENNAKLLAAIVTLHSPVLDTKQLAAVFGPNVPASAISYRLSTLRKEGAGLGIKSGTPNGSNGVAKPAKRAPAVRGNKAKGGKGGTGVLHDVPTDDESADLKEETDDELALPATDSVEHQTTAVKNPHQRNKTISGRPFGDVKDIVNSDGEKVFNTDKSEGEDSFASDADYMKDAQMATIKMEEAI